MEQANGPEGGQEVDAEVLEDQLVKYAEDMKALYRESTESKRSAIEALQSSQLRGREVSALNQFLQRQLTEMFELETAYSDLLAQLEGLLTVIEPAYPRETVQRMVEEGRSFLQRLRA